MNGDFNTMVELLKRYNRGELKISDEKARALAEMAFATKQNFNVKSKPLRKGLFDLVDTAAFGLVPNDWRPESIGQDLHGESGIDRIAGGVGTVAGLGAGGIGVLRGLANAPKVVSTLGAGAKTAYSAGKPLVQSAGAGIKGAYNSVSPVVGRGFRGAREGLGKAYQGASPIIKEGLSGARAVAGRAYQGAKPWVSSAAKSSSDRIKSILASIKENQNVQRAAQNLKNMNKTTSTPMSYVDVQAARFGSRSSRANTQGNLFTPWG